MKDIICEKRDFTYLQWNRVRSSSGTAGSFLKATEIQNGKKIYYKLSCYDSMMGIVGHECINELIVSRLLGILGVEHLKYKLLFGTVKIEERYYDTYFCMSESFRKRGERKITFEDYYQLERTDGESTLDFMKRMGLEDNIYQMIIIDFLILNRDRHGANYELIMDENGVVRPAPLFDQGVSLLFSCHSIEQIHQYNTMSDKPVQSFIGGNSAKDNLNIIPKGYAGIGNKIRPEDKNYLFDGLHEILSEEHIDKIWDMIWKRWLYYENLFNL